MAEAFGGLDVAAMWGLVWEDLDDAALETEEGTLSGQDAGGGEVEWVGEDEGRDAVASGDAVSKAGAMVGDSAGGRAERSAVPPFLQVIFAPRHEPTGDARVVQCVVEGNSSSFLV